MSDNEEYYIKLPKRKKENNEGIPIDEMTKSINYKTAESMKALAKIYTENIITKEQIEKTHLAINNLVKSIAPQLKELSQSYIKLVKETIGSMNLEKVLSDYFSAFQKLNEERLKSLTFSSKSKLSGLDCVLLNKYYWVVPYEYDYSKVNRLSKYKTRKKFEEYMLKYFNDNRTKRLFRKIKSQFNEKDKKELLRQVEKSFLSGDYAICITTLMTLIDGLCLDLIHPNSKNQNNSHNIMGDLLKIMKDKSSSEFGYELYLRVNIINNFFTRLYIQTYDLKSLRKKRVLIRHTNSHGVKYFNDKVNTLRLLNAMYFCNEIKNDINLYGKFTWKKADKQFSLTNNPIN